MTNPPNKCTCMVRGCKATGWRWVNINGKDMRLCSKHFAEMASKRHAPEGRAA